MHCGAGVVAMLTGTSLVFQTLYVFIATFLAALDVYNRKTCVP